MKVLALLLLFCTLTACSFAPDTYLSVTDHAATPGQTEQADTLVAEDYSGLKRAILSFVQAGQSEGTFRVSNYGGDLESDLTDAAYEVAKQTPLGAYAVDYMTHDSTLIVNYYEVNIHITFRRTAREIASLETITTEGGLRMRLQKAVDNHQSCVALWMPSYQDFEPENMVAEYCAANPGTVMETPDVSVSVYPDSGTVRILEVEFTYSESAASLESKEKAVQESIDAAAEYIRYRQTDRDKAELLFTYLMERFTYTAGQTTTPVYDALCGGVADPAGLAHAWQLICDRAGVECYTVTGLRNGEEYLWNIVSDDGDYRQLDLARCVLEVGVLVLRADPEMDQYYWNQELYPACEPLPEEPAEPENPPLTEEPPTEGEPPAEEGPSAEDVPPAEELVP